MREGTPEIDELDPKPPELPKVFTELKRRIEVFPDTCVDWKQRWFLGTGVRPK